jgi:hypothetical protein
MSAGNALTDPQAMLNASPGSIGSLSLDHHRINRHAKLEKPAEQDLQRPSNSQISGTNGHVTSLSAQVAVARMSLVESMGSDEIASTAGCLCTQRRTWQCRGRPQDLALPTCGPARCRAGGKPWNASQRNEPGPAECAKAVPSRNSPEHQI